MLINFSKDKKNIIKELSSLDIKSDEFNSLIHNIKGLSGNLSLYDVFKYSTKIYTSNIFEEKIKFLAKLKDSLTIVMKTIDEEIVPKIIVKSNSNNFFKEEILENIKQLSYDISQGAFITQERKELVINQISQVENKIIAMELEKYLLNFDYTNAQEILRKIIGELS